jgi:hypothetical protein
VKTVYKNGKKVKKIYGKKKKRGGKEDKYS